MNPIAFTLHVDELILQALREDIPVEDVSTNAVVAISDRCEIDLMSKDRGILCGLGVFRRVFELLDPSVTLEAALGDGDALEPGDHIAVLRGSTRAILAGERTALNYLQRMCGIASDTRAMTDLLKTSKTRLIDTRKTSPNNRIFEKYATRVGGVTSHRFGLSDGVLLKDNHIDAAGSIGLAVQKARAYAPFLRMIEVEVESLSQVQEALNAEADIIMLDNMGISECQEAIALIGDRALIEISGNMDEKKIAAYRNLGADFLSSGALTHSARILDLSMKNLRRIEHSPCKS